MHRSAVVAGSGPPGQVLEASEDRFVVAAGEGAVQLLSVQLVGKKMASAAEFLRGHHPFGDRLGPA